MKWKRSHLYQGMNAAVGDNFVVVRHYPKVSQWLLKVNGKVIAGSQRGTPQGGVLMARIAHEMFVNGKTANEALAIAENSLAAPN